MISTARRPLLPKVLGLLADKPEGMSITEIAEALGRKRSAIRPTIERVAAPGLRTPQQLYVVRTEDVIVQGRKYGCSYYAIFTDPEFEVRKGSVRSILAAFESPGAALTATQIAEHVGVARRSILSTLVRLTCPSRMNPKRLYISDWVDDGRPSLSAVYKLGALPDKRKPEWPKSNN